MPATEINGKPAAFVSVQVEDKINIGNFQNVTFTASVGKYVEDDPSVIDATLKSLSSDHCEPFLSDQRQAVLDSLSG